MILSIDANGTIRCLYTEALDLDAIGQSETVRASRVEPGPDGQWYADMAPVGGPVLGPFEKRSLALTAEVDWLEENVLTI
jgi:hypothetical protein